MNNYNIISIHYLMLSKNERNIKRANVHDSSRSRKFVGVKGLLQTLFLSLLFTINISKGTCYTDELKKTVDCCFPSYRNFSIFYVPRFHERCPHVHHDRNQLGVFHVVVRMSVRRFYNVHRVVTVRYPYRVDMVSNILSIQ